MPSVDEEGYQERLAIGNGAMVLLMIFLFPLFPFFFLYRVLKHRGYPHKKISDYKFLGTFLLVCAIYGFLYAAASGPSVNGIILDLLFLFIPSMLMLHKASKIPNKLSEHCVQYRDYIYVNGITSIEELARLTGQQTKTAKNELKHLMNKGLLPDLEARGDRILRLDNSLNPFPAQFQENVTLVEVHSSHRNNVPVPSPAPKPITVECHGCGASMTITEGETKRCEYCGNIISESPRHNSKEV